MRNLDASGIKLYYLTPLKIYRLERNLSMSIIELLIDPNTTR